MIRPIITSDVPRNSCNPAWRVRGRNRRDLRRRCGLSRKPEDEGSRCSSTFLRHLRYDDGAGTRGPSHGGTCRGRACSVPCTSTSAVRERPAGPCAGDVLSAINTILRSTDAGQEANADLQAEDGSSKERCRFQEDPGEAQETLSEKRKTRAWVHKPTLRLF